jgi:hypothetical protein
MKLKLAFMAIAATLALGYQAQASIGVVTNYSKLNVAIIVKTNAATITLGTGVTSTNITRNGIATAKFSNKSLLALFERSEWANTTFPDGAQLVIGWDSGTWDGDVLVVDKTGTNVLFDANYVNSGAERFYITIEEDGAYTQTFNDNDPGFDTWSEDYMYYVQLEDDSLSLYLWGYPTGHQNFTQHWDVNGDYNGWTDSETVKVGGGMGGDQEVNGNSNGSIIGGNINFSGHGTTLNDYWY